MIGEVSRDAIPGALVRVLGKEGTPFGWGLWNPYPLMRIIARDSGGTENYFSDP